MKKVNGLKVYSNEEVLQRYIGKKGDKKRDDFEKKVAKAVKKK